MDTFFSYIPGMASRIGNHVDFPNYETPELVEIAGVSDYSFLLNLNTLFAPQMERGKYLPVVC